METDFRSNLIRESLYAALQARELIVKFTTFHINQDDLCNGLRLIKAKEVIFSNWETFTKDKGLYPCLEIYQIIDSLAEEMDYQLRVYGIDSLKDDERQLEISIDILKRSLGMKTINKDNYKQIIQSKQHGGV